ncbi:hypothetical protein CYLTODRAFT_494904 [Cylindrobasidium torrendii FP15055 ss-10]|uniref:F-box domain-containing protein n=1 Tax=Cylindrobasidium torrendii FP15055 ss-10 TaxID=1314674 RepID=A0A0D7AW13_9AGAR|nr:hypothetical protein CYLTODRAFT_494904 [Cylindrobasidium torrendii FP15055 ss-10]
MSSLPIEIKAAVIDCLSGNGGSLSAIALVWPEVLFRIREHRFKSFELRSAKRVAGLLDILESNPAISPLIHSVWINKPRIYAEPKLPRLFELLTNVSIARCDMIHYSSGTQAILRAFSGPYNSVKDASLHFRRRSGMTRLSLDIDGLLVFLRMIPNVERLQLGFNPDLRSGVSTGGRPQVLELASLQILHLPPEVLAAPVFLDQFLEFVALPNISSLYIEELFDTVSLNKVLRLWGNTLKELHFLSLYDDGPATDGSTLTLYLPGGIEVVEFGIVIGHCAEQDAYTDMWTRALEDHCARFQNPALRSISLEILILGIQREPLQMALIHRLDTVIASPELAITHLDWDVGEDYGLYNSKSQRVYEALFPRIYDRFISPMGRLKYGTTCNVE